jgi:3-methyl-2-oxobutanoate hydroxymethyltransferase
MTAPDPRIVALAGRPKESQPLVMLTAYDFGSARIADAAGVDLILVGDSAATVMLGHATTRDISLDELLVLTRAARRGTRQALLVGDLPFGTYETSDDQAVETARRFVEAGCDLVKVEGAIALPRVRAIMAAGIAVIGHVGLLPQGAATVAELRAQGRIADEALAIVRDAVALAAAGCSALVVEAVPSAVAAAIAARIDIPVIGIGAGAAVSGQVLVYHDLLGLGDGRTPKFVRPYASLRDEAIAAVRAFADDVRARRFPTRAEEYGMPEAERVAFEARLAVLVQERSPD